MPDKLPLRTTVPLVLDLLVTGNVAELSHLAGFLELDRDTAALLAASLRPAASVLAREQPSVLRTTMGLLESPEGGAESRPVEGPELLAVALLERIGRAAGLLLRDRLIEDCREVVGMQTVGLRGKQVLWASPRRHTLPASRLVRPLARIDADALLDLAEIFHTEFADVGSDWPVRRALDDVLTDVAAGAPVSILRRFAREIVDDRHRLRWWLSRALDAARRPETPHILMMALPRLYLSVEQLMAARMMEHYPGDVPSSPELAMALYTLARTQDEPADQALAVRLLGRLAGGAGLPALRVIAVAADDMELRNLARQAAKME